MTPSRVQKLATTLNYVPRNTRFAVVNVAFAPPRARSRGPFRAPTVLVSTTRMLGGTGAKVGWLWLVEFDVDRPRSRATDGHSVNATRKTKNQVFARHKSGFIRPDEGKIYEGRAPWAGHDTRRRLQWQRTLLFSFWVLRGPLQAKATTCVAAARSRREK